MFFVRNTFKNNFKQKFNSGIKQKNTYKFSRDIRSKTLHKLNTFKPKDNKLKLVTTKYYCPTNLLSKSNISSTNQIKPLQLFNLMHKQKSYCFQQRATIYCFQQRATTSSTKKDYGDNRTSDNRISNNNNSDSDFDFNFVLVKILYTGFACFCLYLLDASRDCGSMTLFLIIHVAALFYGFKADTIYDTVLLGLIAFLFLIPHVLLS